MSLAEADPPVRSHGDGEGDRRPYVVIGGGPAGLTAGYLLAKAGREVVVLEAEDQVGGLAKTVVDPDGYRFDLGGHRFFTKNEEVNDLWLEIMGDEFLLRPRMSRIFWRGKYLDYPLKGTDVIKKLGPVELFRCGHLLPLGGREAQGPGGELRAVGVQPLRQAAVPPLLQVLHREGLGRPDDRAARRVGRPADQGPVLLQRRQGRLLRQQGQQDQVAHRQVPVPPLRPGPDVGDDDRAHHRDGRRGAPRGARHEARGRRRRGRGGPHPRRGHRAPRRHLLAAAARDGRASSTRRRPPRSARRPRACATATSSPSR